VSDSTEWSCITTSRIAPGVLYCVLLTLDTDDGIFQYCSGLSVGLGFGTQLSLGCQKTTLPAVPACVVAPASPISSTTSATTSSTITSTTPTSTVISIITNGDFESDSVAPWVFDGRHSTFSITTLGSFSSSTYALQAQLTSSDTHDVPQGGFSQDINLVSGNLYNVAIDWKLSKGSVGQCELNIEYHYNPGGGWYLSIYQQSYPSAFDWQSFTIPFAAPGPSGSVRVAMTCFNGGDGDMVFDQFSIIPSSSGSTTDE
jgi:hypothetical protein